MATCMDRAVITTNRIAYRQQEAMSVRGVLLVLAGTAVLLCACERKSEQVSGSAAPSATEQGIRIEDFALGTVLGSHGGIAKGASENRFETGQIVYLAMALKQVPVGTPVNVVWKGPGGEVLGQETKHVRRGQRYLNFAADSGNLPLGQRYRAEVSVNGQTLARLEFDLILSTA
jgi:hypothetical protein